MKAFLTTFALLCIHQLALGAEVRLLDLEPNDAQQYIDKHDTTLKYAPKIETNVPAVRYLGNEPHHVVEDIYLANQYHGQDGLGGYLYGYSVPDIAKTEKKKAGGDLRGAYNYIAGNGQEIKVEYWDDGNGFHQIDNVPKILPKQIDDTPEVKAAKEEHARIWQEQAIRNSKPIENPYAQGPVNQAYPHVQQYQQPQPQTYQQPQYHQPQPQTYQQPQQPQYQQPQPQTYQQPQQPQYQPQTYQQQPQQPQQKQYTGLINQYQQQKQQFPNPGQSVQYQGDQYYQGQQTQTVSQYQQAAGQFGQQKQSEQHDDGEYRETDEGQYKAADDEETGPPKGFFYNFDYPVGIIVQKEGAIQKREGDLKDIYSTNKAIFEKQLQGQSDSRPTRSSTGYLVVRK